MKDKSVESFFSKIEFYFENLNYLTLFEIFDNGLFIIL